MKKRVLFAVVSAVLILTGCTSETQISESAEQISSESSAASIEETTVSSEENVSSTTVQESSSSSTTSQSTSNTSSETIESGEPEIPFNAGKITLKATANVRTINYTIDDDSACEYGSATYSADFLPEHLSSATISCEAENGACFLDENDGKITADLTQKHKLKVVDESGIEKNFTIITEYTKAALPIVQITLDDGKSVSDIMRDETIGMTISIDCSKAPEYAQGLEIQHGKIRGRGNSTWNWDKKPYKIKLDNKSEVLGLAEDKDWILTANYADKSLIRNTVAYDMGRVMNFDWTPSQYPVDLFINGEYQGVYSLGEHMEVADSRVNITKKSEKNDKFGFLLEVGGSENGVDVKNIDYFHTNSMKLLHITFKDPDGSELTDKQRQEVFDLFNAADNAIINGGDIGEFIDIDSFVDWVIIQELTNNSDSAFRRSCYFTVDVGGKIKMGPIWDFDLAFGNYVIDNPYYNSWTIIGSSEENAYIKTSWGNYLMQNKEFRMRLSKRWWEVRDKLLSTAFASIDRYSQKIQPSQAENFKVWQIWGLKVGYSSWANYNANTYDLQIAYLKNFITNRAKWIDNNIDNY